MKALATSTVAALAAVILCAGATPAISRVPAAPHLSQSEGAAVGSLLRTARGQIVIAEYARAHAKSPAVRRLADVVSAEWSTLADRLEPVAAANGETVEATLGASQQRMFDELRQTASEEFDAAYVRIAHTGIDHAMNAFQREATDPQLGTAFRDVQPMFDHLDGVTSVDPVPATRV